ncbi:hypothetical protein C6A63_01875 [Escherichia coli]|uniref:Uncharacterized protein n=4 Tax=Escherichia coli TaxID=562 RepID=B7N8J4_ECOLU|nr:hypothetical protein BE963_15560 [Escherichia coli]ATI06927.1 hypothetical protein CO715_15110 [Escherichia coli M12]EFJ75681.1 hypothetical protein HMPREF9552_00606 [Escherichia coli MS 198-1]EFO3123833.1 hypothetical protein [Escherichia coli O73]CAR11545.1 hypothetical protein ECUMN_0330 [Escherichia coli UMN026]CBG33160.1 hypothetical protein EC042_0326 [Escherichia coli 042]
MGEEYTLSGNQSYCDKSSASKVEITSILEKSILSAKPSSITHPGVYGSVSQWLLTMPDFPVEEIPHTTNGHRDWVLK